MQELGIFIMYGIPFIVLALPVLKTVGEKNRPLKIGSFSIYVLIKLVIPYAVYFFMILYLWEYVGLF
ncbi:hypothetical protein [Listeria innocua]|uniref:hypothetical protein n=1 Tax=Listeria innocua TaxID=1642 RepID=UPI0016299A92|nr:hypothetical protein [Listeria innocua]MBC1925548.1 hypothetical protein [Listeria innocua]